MFLYKTQLSAKRRTDDLIFSGRSLIKMRNRTGPKTDPWGTPDNVLMSLCVNITHLHCIKLNKLSCFVLYCL